MRFMHARRRRSARAACERKVGKTLERAQSMAVEGDTAVARSAADAPEIDGVVRIRGRERTRCRHVRARCGDRRIRARSLRSSNLSPLGLVASAARGAAAEM